MTDERKEEAASLYALDLLEGTERAAFEAELRKDPALQKLVDEFRNATAQLALTADAPAPSAALKARVMASIAETRNAPTDNVVPFRPPVWLGWAAAACFALASAFLGTRYLATKSELISARENEGLAQVTNDSLRQQLEAERIVNGRQIAELQKAGDIANLKIARLADLLNNSPEAVAVAIWNPLKQEGVLTVEKLPALQQDQDYQLWVIDPQYKNPVNGGVFTVDTKGIARVHFRPDQPVTAVTTFAISRERKGGVPKAEGPIVAAGAF